MMSKEKSRKVSKIIITNDGEYIQSEVKDLDLNEFGFMLGNTLFSVYDDIAEKEGEEEAEKVLFLSLVDILEAVDVTPGMLADYMLFCDDSEELQFEENDSEEEEYKKSKKGNIGPIPFAQMQEEILKARKGHRI